MNGVLNIFKNSGMSSFDVVRIVKKVACEKKVGHTGTLDPEAIGVLPVCLGKATKIIDYIMNDKKSYKVKFKLGVTTTTYDLEGEILSETDTSNITVEETLEAINKFKGTYNQVPPMYSALKKNGVRLYELARKGIEVEREGRPITIYDIKDIEINLHYISMEGTYIRSLCYDIGEELKVGACMTELRRTETSCFHERDSINIKDLTSENIHNYIISIEDALKSYPKLKVNEGFSKLLINGVRVMDRRLTNEKIDNNILYRVYDENDKFLGLGKRELNGFKIEKLLI